MANTILQELAHLELILIQANTDVQEYEEAKASVERLLTKAQTTVLHTRSAISLLAPQAIADLAASI